MHHAVGIEVCRIEAATVQLHAQLTRREGPGLRLAHPGDGLEQVFEFAGTVFQLGIGGVVRHQRQLRDVDHGRVYALDLDAADLGGQLSA